MPHDWSFLVEDAFDVTGRGARVFGTLTGTISEGETSAVLEAGGGMLPIDRISVELARTATGERMALLLYGLSASQVPPGAVIRSSS